MSFHYLSLLLTLKNTRQNIYNPLTEAETYDLISHAL